MTALATLLIFAGVLAVWSGLTGNSLLTALGSVLSGKTPGA